ncbi:MAG: hypothetical protein ACREA9_19685 [Pyrinomonadaceae bacterium]
MIMTNKLLPVALVAALIGGSVGAIVMNRTQTATAEPQKISTLAPGTDVQNQGNASGREQSIPAEFNSAAEQNSYKTGFADGFRACEAGASGNQVSTSSYQNTQPRVVYRNTGRNYSTSSRSVSSYSQRPRGRSFWQKHRDKLTVAAGTGGGALIGGLIGGKKGAAIGALSGAGGSALYTYKIRNRNRRY